MTIFNPGGQRVQAQSRAIFRGSQDGSILNVNVIFPLFNNADSYSAGQGVRDSSDTIYVARRNVAVGSDLTNTDDWQEVGEITESELAAAIAAYFAANPVSDPRIFIQSTEPTSGLVDGAVWIDTSGVVNTLNIYNSTQGQFNLVESVTNLAVNRGATSVTITSSSGTDATIEIANTASAGVMSAADKTRLDNIPDYVAASNLPRLTADLVADREYVVWVTNNTGTTPAAIDRTAVDIQGQDAATLQGTTVSVTAGRTIPLYVTWNATAVGDIQNNATNVEPTVTFTTPAATVHVAPGEDAVSGGGETYTLARENNDGTADQATITLTEGSDTARGMVHIRGQNEVVVGESATDANTILIDFQTIPPIHPENLAISVSPTHIIEDTPNTTATVTLRETGTNWRITGVTNPTSSRTGVSFGAVSGSGTQTVTIPVTITSEATSTIGNISLSFRVSGNNGLPTTDPDYQAYRSVVRNVNVVVSPVWYADVLTSAPTALNDFSGNRGEFLIGAQEELTGVAGGTIYVAIPTDAVDERVRFTTSNPNIFYEFTTRSPIGDFSVFNLGTAVAGTYVVRIGGV